MPCERPCLLLVGPKGADFLMPALNVEGSRAHTDLPFWTWDEAEGPGAAFDAAMRARAPNPRRIALDEAMRADAALLLVEGLPQAQRRLAEDTVGALRMIKDEAEIALLRRSAAVADEAMTALFATLAPGMIEREAQAAAFATFAAHDAQPLFGIVGAGPNGAFPHHQAGATVLAEVRWWSTSARGSTAGRPTSPAWRASATRATAMARSMTWWRPRWSQRSAPCAPAGLRGRLTRPRGVITAAGFGPQFVHRTGHGLDVHEAPWITATSNTVPEPGMVFSIEPGIYLPGRFGVRLEEIVVVGDEGQAILASLPRALHMA